MGDFRVRKIENEEDRRRMYQFAIDDIKAFDYMLKERMFEEGDLWIGAEQELCVVDNEFNPTTSALKLLDSINDSHYTNELALFNMEINLDPLPLKGDCFLKMESSLIELMNLGYNETDKINEHIIMTGILPTLKYHHLQSQYMTPIARYKTLSQALSKIRGSKFEVYLQGVDDLIMGLGSVLFEACNTSFQLHLQIKPQDFVNQHNWSQMIAGPVLSACVNSPLLFGNELWSETRIALFKQSLDTRSSQKFLRMKLPRVYFGRGWLKNSPVELWKNDLMRFPLLVTSDDLKDSKSLIEEGKIPDLRGIRLHNGTTYTWNRMCYGYSEKKPHLRIECRYLPSGPTAIDEIANFAFWIGLMRCEPEGGVEFWKSNSFKSVKNNFILAARSGLNTVFDWCGENISAKELLLDKLIPMSRKGLFESGVSEDSINKYLNVIQARVEAEVTGSSWAIHNFRSLSKNYGEVLAEKELVKQSVEYQRANIPIHEWDNINGKEMVSLNLDLTVDHIMSTDIYSVSESASIELIISMLDWNDIHHLPVENSEGDLVGLITDGLVVRNKESNVQANYAKDLMLKDMIVLQTNDTIKEANALMLKHGISGLPVVYKNKLVGMVTLSDINQFIAAQ